MFSVSDLNMAKQAMLFDSTTWLLIYPLELKNKKPSI